VGHATLVFFLVIRLSRELVPTSVFALLLTEIVLILVCYLAALFIFLTIEPSVYLFDEGNYWKLLLVMGCIVASLYFQDLYADIRLWSRILLVQQVCLAVGSALLILAMLGYVSSDYLLPRSVVVFGSLTVVIVVPAWRMFFWKFGILVFARERVLLAGNSPLLAKAAKEVLTRPQLGYSILGYLREGEPVDFPVSCLGMIRDLSSISKSKKPARLVIGTLEPHDALMSAELLELRFAGIAVDDVADFYEAVAQRVFIGDVQIPSLTFTAELYPSQHALAIQNVYSFLIALIGLCSFLPLMLIIALAVKLTSEGPILYRQQRTGLRGKVFTLYKFRSMYEDAEQSTGPVYASKGDRRTTSVGRFLRNLRLDELPQFWNVVLGDMSIVGPRPERPQFVEDYAAKIPYYRERLIVKPGITGWAQINHKYSSSLDDAKTKLEYDFYYIKHLSPALDAYIIFHTLKVMLLQRGAQ
jgi:exopolysaccharide biosynthesis polyprenyl glycosylphosphotransferase